MRAFPVQQVITRPRLEATSVDVDEALASLGDGRYEAGTYFDHIGPPLNPQSPSQPAPFATMSLDGQRIDFDFILSPEGDPSRGGGVFKGQAIGGQPGDTDAGSVVVTFYQAQVLGPLQYGLGDEIDATVVAFTSHGREVTYEMLKPAFRAIATSLWQQSSLSYA